MSTAWTLANRRGAVASMVMGLSLWGMVAPSPAEACGGTFCDGGPAPMPVEQTGETILFVVDEGHVEAHIQIEYDPETEAEQFAWLVPVTALPEFSVGSQRLFSNLLDATVPAYGFGNWTEPCNVDGGGGLDDGCESGNSPAGDDGGEGIRLDVGGGAPGEPDVVLETTVGAFEVFVLDGGTVEGVMQWLGDNGFTQDEAAAPILGEYLAEGHLFVAFRLTAEAGVGEIHPITLRFAGDEPCVPIRLTRIAAQDDMEIRALFLGEHRVASSNYRHVTLNPLRLDWMGRGVNYREVVAMAVDEPGANGHAFVTEYAGTSDVVSRDGLVDARWNSSAFMLANTPAEAVSLLLEQALVGYADSGECEGLHPLVEGLVAQHLPTTEEFPLATMCMEPEGFAAAVEPMAWDPLEFARVLEERVVLPGLRAEDLLDTWPFLTRMYTAISPHEMTEDPMFHATPELLETIGPVRSGTLNTFCDGALSFGLPDGRLVNLDGVSAWPSIAPDSMPWAETVQYLPAAGAPVVEVDHRALIDSLLDAWHEERGLARSPTSSQCGAEGTGGASAGGTGPGIETSPGADGGGPQTIDCTCRSRGPGAGAAWWLLLVLGLRRRSAY